MSPGTLDNLRQRWVTRLGLARLAARPAPFGLSGWPTGKPPGLDLPDITVLVPAFQHERYITEALRSVLAQTYQGFEILVVDDSSSDRTVSCARAINDSRITIKVNQRNLGLGGSLVAALADVRTPFVAVLNSDDLFHPERLERCRDLLLSEPALCAVATGVVLTDSRGGRLTPESASRILDGRRIFHWMRWYGRVHTAADDSEPLFLRLLRHNFLLSSSNIVCRTAFLGEEAEAIHDLNFCIDWHLFLTAAGQGRLGLLPDALLGYRLHGTNTVWFSPAGQTTYRAETSVVAAGAIRRFGASQTDGAVLRELAKNPDVNIDTIRATLEAN